MYAFSCSAAPLYRARECLLQVPEDEIDAVHELPRLDDMKASQKADLKVLMRALTSALRAGISANPACR
jgi:hypothetical protein